MDRRKETRTVTRAVETRIEFSAADLRKRLRLPDDAKVFIAATCALAEATELYVDEQTPLVATFTRTTTKGA
jgi:hypothetical protein